MIPQENDKSVAEGNLSCTLFEVTSRPLAHICTIMCTNDSGRKSLFHIKEIHYVWYVKDYLSTPQSLIEHIWNDAKVLLPRHHASWYSWRVFARPVRKREMGQYDVIFVKDLCLMKWLNVAVYSMFDSCLVSITAQVSAIALFCAPGFVTKQIVNVFQLCSSADIIVQYDLAQRKSKWAASVAVWWPLTFIVIQIVRMSMWRVCGMEWERVIANLPRHWMNVLFWIAWLHLQWLGSIMLRTRISILIATCVCIACSVKPRHITYQCVFGFVQTSDSMQRTHVSCKLTSDCVRIQCFDINLSWLPKPNAMVRISSLSD